MPDEKKKRAINRLQTMYPLRALVTAGYEQAVEASKAGEPVVWSMVTYWEADPILKAMGVIAVYPENYGAVCAAFGAAPAYMERSQADGFPTHLCGYARNCFGYTARMTDLGQIPPEAPMGGMPKPTLLLSSGGLCDARFKWFQSLARYLDTPMQMLNIPHPGVAEGLMPGAYECNINFMVEELKEFVTFLERLSGKKMDWDRLAETTDDMIEMARVWHEVNELRKAAKPGPMHSRDFWSCMNALHYLLGDLKATIDLYRKVYDEVKYRVDNKIGAVSEEKYRMAFGNLPPWHSLGFFDRLAERGWNFVIETSYHPPKPMDYSKVSNPLERLARFSYRLFTGYDEGASENGEWWGLAYRALEEIGDSQCDGALLHPLISCRASTINLPYVQERLMKKLKVPSLVLEGDVVDLNVFDPDEGLRKAEAFEEVMEHYRRVRQEEVLD